MERPQWDAPLRLLGGVHYLLLAGLAPDLARAYDGAGDPWPPFRETLAANRDWLARFVAEQQVQTNEVQRCWGLLPAFLTIARAVRGPFDLVELGPSAGLNLLWDRYRYRYGDATWGPLGARLELDGEARGGPPPDLLATEVEIRSRLGIDLSPVDVTTEHGARLLQAFVWADQRDRLERLRRAIGALREGPPPQLVGGDYVELLPELLARRDESTLTVVYQTASTVYLTEEERARLRQALAAAGAAGPLAWVSTTTFEERDEDYDGNALELRIWPDGDSRLLLLLDFHGAWLEWLG